MAEIFVPKTEYTVKSGKKVAIIAILRGWAGKKSPKLIWLVSDGEGEITDKGQFIAPVTKKDEEAKVTILSIDSTIDPKEVTVKIQKADVIKTHQRNAKIISGSEFPFSFKSDFPVHQRWEIVDFSREKGNINPQTGLYQAPDLIKSSATIKIRIIDLNSGMSDEVEIELLPVELRINPQPKVHAGQEKVQLNIESHNDLSGLDNFSCKIISSPLIGVVKDGGIYKPPAGVDKIETVKVEATSKLDETKKVVLEFEVGFPLCKNCKSELTQTICPSCDKPATYGVYLRRKLQ